MWKIHGPFSSFRIRVFFFQMVIFQQTVELKMRAKGKILEHDPWIWDFPWPCLPFWLPGFNMFQYGIWHLTEATYLKWGWWFWTVSKFSFLTIKPYLTWYDMIRNMILIDVMCFAFNWVKTANHGKSMKIELVLVSLCGKTKTTKTTKRSSSPKSPIVQSEIS